MRRKPLHLYLTQSKAFRNINPNASMSDYQKDQLHDFDVHIGLNYDRTRTLAFFCKYERTGWVESWTKLRQYQSGDLIYQQMLHGDAIGLMNYEAMNLKKKSGLPNSLEYWEKRGFSQSDAQQKVNDFQIQMSLRSAQKLQMKPQSARTCRQVGYWIAKGLSEEAAIMKVKSVQTTNGLDWYIAKYGDVGVELFHKRIDQWQNSVSENPENADIGYKRSHSLTRYIDRYGEALGLVAYEKYHLSLRFKSRTASKESLLFFEPILQLLNERNIEHIIGGIDKREFHIYDKETKDIFFYDLAIPSLRLILEYHGTAWHPDPQTVDWDTWRHPYTRETAIERYEHDRKKANLAIKTGWSVDEIYSNRANQTRVQEILQLICDRINNLH